MFSLIYSELRSLKKENLGLGKFTQLSSMRRLGFNLNFFGNSLRKFKFICSRKIDSIFSIRLSRLLKNDLLSVSSLFNLNLQRRVLKRIDLLKFNRSWRGVRHINNLPVRGQRTKTNARTRKSRRVRK